MQNLGGKQSVLRELENSQLAPIVLLVPMDQRFDKSYPFVYIEHGHWAYGTHYNDSSAFSASPANNNFPVRICPIIPKTIFLESAISLL